MHKTQMRTESNLQLAITNFITFIRRPQQRQDIANMFGGLDKYDKRLEEIQSLKEQSEAAKFSTTDPDLSERFRDLELGFRALLSE
jgi:hypothetical protein